MIASAPSTLDTWLGYAQLGIPIVPEHTPDPSTVAGCDCRKDDCHKPGKHPRTKNGSSDATTDEETSLEMAGLVIIGPDSPEWHEEFKRRGLHDGPVAQSGGGDGHLHYYRRLPEGVPATRICKPGEYDILAKGNAILSPSLHESGRRYEWLVPITSLDEIPYLEQWACAELRAAGARRERSAITREDSDGPPIDLSPFAIQVYNGDLPKVTPEGKVDRSGTLLKIGRVLYDAGARRRLIVDELAEIDAARYRKYSTRGDASEQYNAIVDELERTGRTQRLVPVPATSTVEGITADDGHLDCREANRLRGLLLDRDDRLEVLEDIVHSIDDVLNRPNEEMSASDKVVLIATARWLPFYRSKKEAQGKAPTISLGYVAKVCGSSKSTVSSTFKRFSSVTREDGAPFHKHVQRKLKVDANGSPVIDPTTGQSQYESELTLTPWNERPSETLRAAVGYAKVQVRPKHGGSKEAADSRWGRCDKHDNRAVRVKGYCPDCGKVVGERIVKLAEFDALNEQVAHSEETGHAPPTVVRNPIGEQVAHSEGRTTTLRVFGDVGDPDAPHGSEAWCRWVHFETLRRLENRNEAGERLERIIRVLRDPDVFSKLADRNGRPFIDFTDYCQTPPPYGLGVPAETLNLQVVVSDPPVSLPDYAATRSQPGDEVGGPKCGQPKRNGETCTASWYRALGGGWLHCLGCGADHEPLAAVAGGEE